MNINQINALRKLASAHDCSNELEKEASVKRNILKGVAKLRSGAKSVGKTVKDAYGRTAKAFEKGGVNGALKSVGRQGKQAGKAVADRWNSLDGNTKAAIAGVGGALGGASLSRALSGGEDEEARQPQRRGGYRYR